MPAGALLASSPGLLQPATNATIAIRTKLNSFFISVVVSLSSQPLVFLHPQEAFPSPRLS